MKVLFISNTCWYLYNFRLPLMQELQSRNIDVVAVAPEDKWVGKLHQSGIHTINIEINRKGQNIYDDIKLIRALYKIYCAERPDYVLHFTIKPVVFGTIASMLIKGINVINNITGLGYVFIGTSVKHKYLQPLVRSLYRFSMRHSYRLFFQNDDDKNYFLKHRLFRDENKMIIVPGSGVDTNYFKMTEERKSRRKIKFLYVGRIIKDKGVTEIFLAAQAIRKFYNNVEFGLVGDFDLDNPEFLTKDEMGKWIQDGIIKYHGRVTDVKSLLAESDVFVLPSYREGMPRSTLEALAMSLPIITTDVPGCKETVIHGRNGLLIPMKNVPELIKAIKYMIENPDERIKMGKESRKIAIKKFDVKIVNRIYLQEIGIN